MSSETTSNQFLSKPGNEDDSNPSRKPATIVRGLDGTVRGVAIVLTADDLRNLGLSLTDTTAVVPKVYNGALLIEPAN